MAYTSLEEQDINELKSWLNDNYKMLITIVVLVLIGVFGWRYWQDHQANKSNQLSSQYDQIVLSNKPVATKNSEIDAFVATNGKTSYATFALLEKAKLAAQNNDLPVAASALQQAINESPDEILSSVAAIRLASVQIQQKEFDAALNSLAKVKDQTWEARKLLLTGDVQLAKGDKTAAKASYQEAQKNATQIEKQWLQARLNLL